MMLALPINASTFKKSFLDGNGTLEIHSDQDLWATLYKSGQAFRRDVDDVAEVTFGAGTSKDFVFGHAQGWKIGVSASVGASHQISLLWPDGGAALLKAYGLEEFLTPDKLYVRVVFRGRGEGSVKGSFVNGPLSATFGVQAGGEVLYERLQRYAQTDSVRAILGEALGGIRLPQQIQTKADIPDEGEVLVTRYGGYLKLTAGVSFGYSLTGTRSFEVSDLSLELDYRLRLLAGLSLGYSLAGDFQVEARKGQEDGWVRLVVRKNRESEFGFAADFGLDSGFEVTGLPDAPDEFLKALFGADAESVLSLLDKAEKYSSLDELEQAAGKLSKDFLGQLSKKWLNKALSDKTLKEFLGVAHEVASTYASLDQRIIDLYEDHLGQLGKLDEVVDLLLGVGSREDLEQLTDSRAWEFIRRVWNDRLHDLLLEQEEFERFHGFLEEVKKFRKGEAAARARDLVAEAKKAFPLDRLLQELAKYDTPEKLQKLTDEKLQGLVEKLVGKTFEELKGSQLNAAVKQVNAALKTIQSFKDDWYGKLKQSAQQSFQFDLHYAYTHASRDRKLLDVEFNLAKAQGRQLLQAAAKGDFQAALAKPQPGLVRVNEGVLTHEVVTSAQVQVNILGWGYTGLSEMVQNSQHAIEAEASGLMHVYTQETQIKQRQVSGRKYKETLQSNFLFRAVGETFQPAGAGEAGTNQYLIQTLRHLAVQYDLLHEDERTSPEELTQYLALAEFLGLIGSRHEVVRQLEKEFPDGLGKVSASYVVRFEDRSIRNAFTLSGKELEDQARETVRQLVAARYTGMRVIDWQQRVGFAYLAPAVWNLYRRGWTVLRDTRFSVTIPAWAAGGQARSEEVSREQRQLLVTLFRIEDDYVKALARLDNIIDRAVDKNQAVPVEELARASRDFLSHANDLNKFGLPNTFFAVFDKLVHIGGSGKGNRKSALILEITAPGKERVTKYLMAPGGAS